MSRQARQASGTGVKQYIKKMRKRDPELDARWGSLQYLSRWFSVYQRFKKETPTQISETSHHEDAWKKYLNSDSLISFEMAFSLKAI